MSKVKIQAARLSFPSLFNTAKFGGEDTGKYEATFVLDKVEHADTIASIHDNFISAQRLSIIRIVIHFTADHRSEFSGIHVHIIDRFNHTRRG